MLPAALLDDYKRLGFSGQFTRTEVLDTSAFTASGGSDADIVRLSLGRRLPHGNGHVLIVDVHRWGAEWYITTIHTDASAVVSVFRARPF